MTDKSLAIHEAGHAVIGRALDMVCGHATIEEDADSDGHSICADPWLIYGQWDNRGKYRDVSTVFHGRILTFMAGAEAEIEILGECSGGDGDDRQQIQMMADSSDSGFSADQWARFEPRMRRKCRRLIRHHRAAIERVAHALLRKKTLVAEEIALLALG